MRYKFGVRTISTLTLSLAMLASLGCSDDHGVTCPEGEPSIASMTLTPLTVAAGGDIDVVVVVENFELTGEPHAHPEREPISLGPRPQHSEEEVACPGGHVHVYLDDLMTNPLTQAVTSEFILTIPDDTALGPHTIIGRLHNQDHTIFEPAVVAEVDITVE